MGYAELAPRNPNPATLYQRAENRGQMTDAGNQIAWIVHSRDPFEPPAPSIERCPTLSAMPFALFARNPQLVTRNAALANI